MKALIWYCKELKIGNIKKSTRMKPLEQAKEKDNGINEKNVLMPWITVESKNDENVFEDFLNDLNNLAKIFKTNKIVLAPFAHLTSLIPKKEIAFHVFSKLSEFLQKHGFEVKEVHFGSYKDIKFYSPASEHQVMFRSYPKDFIKK